jgi:predicted ATPase/signal transduction histidine kinase
VSKTNRSSLQKIWEDADFILSRETAPGGSDPRLILAPTSERPSPDNIRRLEYLHSLRARLDSTWFARPISVVWQNGLPALLLEDPGGTVLEQRLGRPLKLQLALRLGIGIASALGRFHASGFIHRALNPNNVFIDFDTGEAQLVGAYIALCSSSEGSEAPEPLGVNLAYLAPEQTGRMNRSPDSRSDLYAFGVMLYQMVTGVLPFTAKDPMEWIHGHLAIQPMPPSQRAKAVPDQLSAIIMKLLAKMPEDRYQTATGVEKDLKKCLETLESGRLIAPFPLGMCDVPQQLLISEKLYGRDSEIQTLVSALKRVASDGRPELLLVSGPSGIGKTALVNHLSGQSVAFGGLFASGKFDQYKENIPYTTVTQAFETLVRQILSKSDTKVRQWLDRITGALGSNARLISNLLPELDLIVGKQPPVRELPPQDARDRFKIVFRRFVGVFARPEHPLVLFLDDLQWADAGTLGLLEHLLTEPDVRHLLLIGAYRDGEINSLRPLNQTLEKLRDAGVTVRELPLAPLVVPDVAALLDDSFHSESGCTKLLAQLICEKTGGNPFFIIQFFKALVEESLVVFDPAIPAWNWKLELIGSRDFTRNIDGLLVDKLDGLTAPTQQVLKQLACLGTRATISAIGIASELSKQLLDVAIDEAMRAGLVVRHPDSVKFTHDRVQEAAYNRIPEADRAMEHLRIGRLLIGRLPANQVEDAIFEIVNQLNRGVLHVQSAEERNRLLELNVVAGKRAKAAAAHVSALSYFTVSNKLLDRRSKYETAFTVGLNLAECELLTGQLTAADERLLRLSVLAQNFEDRIAVARLLVVLYTTSNRSPRAIEVCLECLQFVGLACPLNPTPEEIAHEYERIWMQLGDRAIEDLIDSPPMTDPAIKAILETLTAVVPPSWFTVHNLRDLLAARMVNLSLKYGNSDASCYAYAVLARTLGSRFGDYHTGYRFGKLSLKLLDKLGSERFRTRVYTCFGHHIDPWNRHLKHGREWLRLASTTAPEAGDLAFASYNRSNMLANLLASGEPLIKVQNEAETALQFAKKIGFGMVADLVSSQLACVRALRGLTSNMGSFDGPDLDEQAFEKHLESDPELSAAKFRHWMRKLQIYFYAGNCSAAVAAAVRVQHLRWESQSFFEVAEYCFFSVLAHAGLCSAGSEDQRINCLNAIVVHRKLISTWAQNCPENFGSMDALVEAEVAGIEGRDLDAERLYENSLNCARENRFVHHEALANELAGKFYLKRGLPTIAYTYLRNARYCYSLWGAIGKVRRIDHEYPGLTEDRVFSLAGANIDGGANSLDSAAVVKALQAVSGEIVLAKLIKTLMQIAVEHAGAERGLFLLVSNDRLQIEAEAATINGQVEFILKSASTDSPDGQEPERSIHSALIRHSSIGAANREGEPGEDGSTTYPETISPGVSRDRVFPHHLAAPQSVLQYVLRTREGVMLEDTSARNLFPDDEYLNQRRPKSVLCMPIIRQDEVVGILYLENNLTTLAFTSYRIHVLKLLASQASISLENARLYSERKRAEEALRASEQVARGQVEALTYSLDILATAPEPEKFLGKMLSTICRLLNGQSAALWLFDEPTDSLVLRLVVDSVSQIGVDPQHPLLQNPRSWKEDLVIQELFFAAGPVVCEDVETDPRVNDQFREYFMPKGTKKFLAVPILVGGKVRGIISVRHSNRAPYRTEEIGLMQALAHQVMLAIRLTEVGEQSRQAAVLAERNRMARDVHDTLAQGFTGVIVQLEAAEYALSDGDRKETNRHLRRAGELARSSLSEARRSVHALRPQILEQDDFWFALKGIVKSTTVATTLETRFAAKGKIPVLPPVWQENLLRIGQEALTNTLKYARAKHFRTRLTSDAKEIRLELCDDGNGFEVTERHDGVGLAGMRERVQEMGGELKIVSSRGRGTKITVILPKDAIGRLTPHSKLDPTNGSQDVEGMS